MEPRWGGNKMTGVRLFITCLVDNLYPDAAEAVVTVLERHGITVAVPEGQTCCGQPAFNAGFWDDARAMARHTLDLLSRSDSPIVVPSGSCADMLVHHYPEILAGDPAYGPKAEAVAAQTYEFTQFLVDVLGVSDLDAHFDGKVTYHPSCHLLRGLGVTEPPRRLLAEVAGAEVIDLPDATECCGFGGLFAVKMGDISGAMLQRKLDAIESTGAGTVVGCDVSCLMHIGGWLRRRGSAIRTRHLAELLVGAE